VFGLPTTVRLEEVPEVGSGLHMCARASDADGHQTETWARETGRFHYGDMHNACSMR
jgi:hypothetical protein